MAVSHEVDAVLEQVPLRAFSHEVNAVLEQTPFRAFSGEVDSVLDQLAVRWASPEIDADLEQIPLRAFSLEVEALFPIASGAQHGGPTAGLTLFPSPYFFGGNTAGYSPILAPPRHFGEPTGDFARLAPIRGYCGPTDGAASALIPIRGFGGSTSGVTEGIEAPINLTATVLGAGEIQLDWIDPGPEEDGFRIERSLTGLGDWETIGVVAADVETFEDRFAVPLVVYDYRVFGFDAVKDSPSSNIATAVTPLPPDLPVSPPPGAPTDPIRNRIEPDPVDFESPGVYGLEKGPDGDVTGFKF